MRLARFYPLLVATSLSALAAGRALANPAQMPLTVPSAQAQASAQTAVQSARQQPLSEEVMKLRDPFKRPAFLKDAGPPKTILERYAIDSFKLVGVLTGPNRMRAVLLDPEGKTHIISERMKIGTRQGVIHKIQPSRIQIREKVTNVFGQVENQDSELLLMEKSSTGEAGKVSIGTGTNGGTGANGGSGKHPVESGLNTNSQGSGQSSH